MYYLPSCLSKVTLFVTCYVVGHSMGYYTHLEQRYHQSYNGACLGCYVLFVLFIQFCSIPFHPAFTTSYKICHLKTNYEASFSVPPVYDYLQYR